MNKKQLLSIFIAVVLLLSVLAACKPAESGETFEASYVLATAACDGVDVTDDFMLYNVDFSKDGKVSVVVNYLNMLQTRNGTYSVSGEVVTESFEGKTYTYRIIGDVLLTTFDDDGTEISVTLTKKVDDDGKTKAVDFQSVLFGDDISDTKKFNYCPAILTETDSDGNTVMHIWYCTNKDSGVIMDHIGYRTGTLQSDGKWLFSEEKIVLAPTEGTWDGRHTCDPAVIKGEFKMGGQTYNYLMAYLGCTTEDYQKNETGLAVAKDVGGPWVKVDSVNPIVPWYDDGDQATEQAEYERRQGTSQIYWGTGMPSLISVDGKGEVLLFYSSTKRGTGVRRLDLSDIDHPVVKFTTSLNHNGIVNSRGIKCNVGIADFAFDPVAKRLYVVGVTNDKLPEDVTKTLVNSHSVLAYVDGVDDTEAVCAALQGGSYKWNVVGYVGPDDTGWNRNHNPGMVRSPLGYIADSSKIGVVVSTGNNDWPNENIFTYRLFGHWFNIK